MDASISVLKLLSKKQISRELFKVCRLYNFESLGQIEDYFSEHQTFEDLKWCGPAERAELEVLIGAGLKRLASRWQIPNSLLESPSVVRIADFLLDTEFLPEKQLEVFLRSFRVYSDSLPATPSEVATDLELTERSVRHLRKRSLSAITQNLQALQVVPDDLQQHYDLDLKAQLLLIDEHLAQQVNLRAQTNFSPQFLGLLFGEYLKEDFVLLGNPEEVLAGNFLGIRHYWKHFYLLKKDFAAALDAEALVKECFRLLHNGATTIRRLNFRTFVSHFAGNSAAEELDRMLPAAAEILFREFGLKIDVQGRLLFPPQALFPLCSYARQALELLGQPSRLEQIRMKVGELHPGHFVDPVRFDLVLLERWGFTRYEHLYGLKDWDPNPQVLEELLEDQPKRSGDYWKQHWEQRLEAVYDFTEDYGRLPEKEGPPEEKILWEWLRRQQEKHRKGTLEPQQEVLYGEFREQFPVRSGHYWKELWEERYQELQDFAQSNRRPPSRSATGKEKELYRWYKLQRVFLKKGRLSISQKVLLREFSERYPLKTRSSWEFRFRQLTQFVEQQYRLPGQQSDDEQERSLSFFWLRNLELMKQGKLTPEREAGIRELKRKFPYNAEHHKQRWEERFEELKSFTETYGLPRGKKSTGQEKTLRGWLINQRIRSKKGELDSRQHRLLKQFDEQYQGNEEVQRKTEWDRKFSELNDFANTHSRLPSREAEEEKGLYRWFVAQRSQLKKGTLDERQEAQIKDFLDRFPIQTKASLVIAWYKKLEEVEAFAASHSRLPMSVQEEEQPLYKWLKHQLARAAEGKLDPDQQQRLQALEARFPIQGPLEEHWHERFQELRAFVTTHGRLPKRAVAAKERSLYYWAGSQIKRMRQGKLKVAQSKLLVELAKEIM